MGRPKRPLRGLDVYINSALSNNNTERYDENHGHKNPRDYINDTTRVPRVLTHSQLVACYANGLLNVYYIYLKIIL